MPMRWLVFVTALLALAMTTAAQAQSVTLNGQLGNQQALLVIDGAPTTVAVGASVRGIKLLSLASGQAEVSIDGNRRVLVLGAAPVRLRGEAGAPDSGAKSIALTANGDGHFIAQGTINGGSVSFMVDTGATVVSISQADADRLGLKYKDAPTAFANTANGRVPVRSLVLNSVRVGEVEVANVEAIVLPSQMPHVLLGNSFLTRFSMRRDNDQMRLEKRPN
jgi:aspartyl protease family protein